MSFGMNKCNKITIIRGKVSNLQNDITLNCGENLKSLENGQQYRYLGFNERETIDKTTKKAIKIEYFKRVKMILKSELNSQNSINAINMYAVPTITYGIPILDWTITELEVFDRETRKLLQQYNFMIIQSDVTWLYIPRRKGSRGLINICEHYKNAIINFGAYLLNSEEDLLKMTSDWQTTRGDKSIHTKVVRYCGEVDEDLNHLVTLTKLQRKNKLKVKKTKSMISTLSAKELHGQHFRHLLLNEFDERKN